MTKVFSLGQTFVVNGTEWIGREYQLNAAFEGWVVVATNSKNEVKKFSLQEVEIALGL